MATSKKKTTKRTVKTAKRRTTKKSTRAKRPQYRAAATYIAAALVVTAVPATLTGLMQSIDDDGVLVEGIVDQRPRALQDRVRVRLIRRQLRDAQNVYRDLLRKGVNEDLLPVPDVNDPDSVEWYFDESNIFGLEEQLHGSAHQVFLEEEKEEEEEGLQYDDLLETDQDTINGYVTTRFCPKSILKTHAHLPGFYELCLQKLDEQEERDRKMLFDRSAYLRGWSQGRQSAYQSLRHRMEILDESLGGRSLRPEHSGRPSTR